MNERILGILPDARHEPARAPAPDWLFGGPPQPDEREGWFHGPKTRFDLVMTDRRLVAVAAGGGSVREREASYAAHGAADLAAIVPGCRSIGPADVAEIVVDRLPVSAGEYSSDWGTDVVLRTPLGAETRFRAIDDRRTVDEVIEMLRPAFGERVRRAKVVRHGLFRRATRE
jgi:hypothetical protein